MNAIWFVLGFMTGGTLAFVLFALLAGAREDICQNTDCRQRV